MLPSPAAVSGLEFRQSSSVLHVSFRLYPRLNSMVFRRTLGCARGGGSEPSGYRFRRQRYAAKLIAFALFSSVRSFAGRRRLPLLSVVPTATSSWAAHASYMHVWAIASARATIGGPFRSARLRRTSASAAAFQSLTTVACAEIAHTKVTASVNA